MTAAVHAIAPTAIAATCTSRWSLLLSCFFFLLLSTWDSCDECRKGGDARVIYGVFNSSQEHCLCEYVQLE
ncbi:hypothetical protein BDZ91DRAFT_714369 [Kalaharituber pfeilii]|nr:hypothetical protein BDZ91DRAFT_714369 [Kalaharituber pfeilii]